MPRASHPLKSPRAECREFRAPPIALCPSSCPIREVVQCRLENARSTRRSSFHRARRRRTSQCASVRRLLRPALASRSAHWPFGPATAAQPPVLHKATKSVEEMPEGIVQVGATSYCLRLECQVVKEQSRQDKTICL